MIRYSMHAREQMVERGISVSEVENAIRKGNKEFQKPNKILYHFGYFTVVTKKFGEYHFVITVKPGW